jgi:hypothetical protein
MECESLFESLFINVKEKSDQQGRDYKKGLLYFRTLFLLEI